MALKPREFGREITNAATSSSNGGSHGSKQNHSVLAGSTATTTVGGANPTAVASTASSIGGITGLHSKKAAESVAHPNKFVSASQAANLSLQGANSRVGSQRNIPNQINFGTQKTAAAVNPLRKTKSTMESSTSVGAQQVQTAESSENSRISSSSSTKSQESPLEALAVKESAEEVRERCKERLV